MGAFIESVRKNLKKSNIYFRRVFWLSILFSSKTIVNIKSIAYNTIMIKFLLIIISVFIFALRDDSRQFFGV